MRIIGNIKISRNFRSIKHEVERRVVTQLALAHETDQLSRDCTVRFVADVNFEEKGESRLRMRIRKKGKEEEEDMRLQQGRDSERSDRSQYAMRILDLFVHKISRSFFVFGQIFSDLSPFLEQGDLSEPFSNTSPLN